MEKQTFEIPKGCSNVTVEQIGNQIVTTFEPEKYIPKVGDCVKLEADNRIIFLCVTDESEEYVNSKVAIINGQVQTDYAYNKNGGWYKSDKYRKYTKITNEEYQSEHNKLGYEYDFETHEAKKLKWKPEYGEKYYYVSDFNEIDEHKWINDKIDNIYYSLGNCYRTHDEAIPRQQHNLSFKD